jgi:parallel beta-helix repeat protein
MRLKAAAVAVLILVSAAAHAAERFVATSGNDANAGTLASPFKTINKAAAVSLPGDVVSVRGGIYNTAVSVSAKGTATARIVIRSYPGEKAVIDGTGLGTSTILVNFSGTQYLDFTGFEVRNAPYIGINIRNGHSTRIADNVIHHTYRGAVYFGADAMGGSTDAIIENNVAYNNVLENTAHSTSGGWAGTLVITRTNGATIRGNRVYNNDGEAIIVNRSDNALVYGNELFDNFSQGVFLDNARFTTVDSNLIYSTGNTRYFRDGFPGQGIAIANETYTDSNPSTDNTIVNNIVVGTRWGFYYGNFENGGGLKNTRVANNTFHKTAQEIVRIAVDAHANSVIENNIFHTAGGSGTSIAGSGVTFRNNNWYGVNAGAAAGSGDVIGNPNFANAGGFTANDYRVQTGSVAIARAADLLAVVKNDYFGAARALPFDIGAHQYSTGAPADTQAPTVPAGVRATDGQGSTISITWNGATDNVGVSGYTVLRNGVAIADVTTNSYNDRSVSPKVLYNYQVVAYDAAGNRSAASSVLSVAWKASEGQSDADTVAPSAPLNFRVADKAAYTVTMAWTVANDNVGVTKYRVYQNGVLIGHSVANAFTATSLETGKTYSFTVEAVDAAGNVSQQSGTLYVAMAKKRRAA